MTNGGRENIVGAQQHCSMCQGNPFSLQPAIRGELPTNALKPILATCAGSSSTSCLCMLTRLSCMLPMQHPGSPRFLDGAPLCDTQAGSMHVQLYSCPLETIQQLPPMKHFLLARCRRAWSQRGAWEHSLGRNSIGENGLGQAIPTSIPVTSHDGLSTTKRLSNALTVLESILESIALSINTT